MKNCLDYGRDIYWTRGKTSPLPPSSPNTIPPPYNVNGGFSCLVLPLTGEGDLGAYGSKKSFGLFVFSSLCVCVFVSTCLSVFSFVHLCSSLFTFVHLCSSLFIFVPYQIIVADAVSVNFSGRCKFFQI